MTKIILNRNVAKLGKAGETKTVADGFARNFLFPRKLAVPFSEGALRGFEKKRVKIEAEYKNKEKNAMELKTKFDAVRLEFPMLTDSKGELYGSVGKGQIIKALKSRGLALPRGANIKLERPLKSLGDFEVPVELHTGVTAKIRITLTQQATPQTA